MPVEARDGFPTILAILWDVAGDWCPHCPPGVGAVAVGMENIPPTALPCGSRQWGRAGIKRDLFG